MAGGAGHLMHLSSASGGIAGGQGENLDDDVYGCRSLLGGCLLLVPHHLWAGVDVPLWHVFPEGNARHFRHGGWASFG